ncbi:phosphoserine phosphatase SerB [Candidatus Pantoea edessiphila]|nr:phosphoserine phosphatase SerB [Candidatus Pantoea edessiphila]
MSHFNFCFHNTNTEILHHCSSNETDWIFYGKELNKRTFINYQKKLDIKLVIINFWTIDKYKVVSIKGLITETAISLAYKLGWDVAPLINIPDLKKPGLLILDMDSTAIQIECIDEIAKIAYRNNFVKKITKSAMKGEIDFVRSLKNRVEMLKGVKESVLKQVLDTLPLTSGLIELVENLKLFNWEVAIISSGFKYYASYLEKKLNLVESIANDLEIEDGQLTGKLVGKIVDSKYKLNSLKKISNKLNIALEQTIAIGDGYNDLLMIKSAGLGIAYKANYYVNKQVIFKIINSDLMGVFCILSSTIY